jgi:hypothetical protein
MLHCPVCSACSFATAMPAKITRASARDGLRSGERGSDTDDQARCQPPRRRQPERDKPVPVGPGDEMTELVGKHRHYLVVGQPSGAESRMKSGRDRHAARSSGEGVQVGAIAHV